jgi:hypothetical protein
MPSKQDRPDREVGLLSAFVSERVRCAAERPAAGEAEPAAVEQTGQVRRPLVPLFEPSQPDPAPATSSPVAAGTPRPVTSFQAPRWRPRAWLLVAPAVTLAIGLAAGFALGATRAGGEPTSAPATRPPATQPAPAPPTSVVVQLTATSACLETARRGDQLIHLFATNQRDRAAELLVAYSVASRQCRRDASP